MKINSRRDFDKEAGARRISNLNRIRALERKLGHKENEITELRQSNRVKDYKYEEMKKKAKSLQSQLRHVQFAQMYQQPFQRPPTMFNPMAGPMIMPNSVSLESIKVPDHILAQAAS